MMRYKQKARLPHGDDSQGLGRGVVPGHVRSVCGEDGWRCQERESLGQICVFVSPNWIRLPVVFT